MPLVSAYFDVVAGVLFASPAIAIAETGPPKIPMSDPSTVATTGTDYVTYTGTHRRYDLCGGPL